MVLDDLLSRRLVVLSGKGGVGKSVVGTALALAARERGKRVLLVEVRRPARGGAAPRRPPVGRPRDRGPPRPLHRQPRPGSGDGRVRPPRRASSTSWPAASWTAPSTTASSPPRPGLKELMVLGKIMVLEEARAAGRAQPRYDLVVVDAPGHRPRPRVPQGPARRLRGGAGRPRRPQRPAHPGAAARPARTALVVVARPRGDGGGGGGGVPPHRRRGGGDGAARGRPERAATSAASPTRRRPRSCA